MISRPSGAPVTSHNGLCAGDAERHSRYLTSGCVRECQVVRVCPMSSIAWGPAAQAEGCAVTRQPSNRPWLVGSPLVALVNFVCRALVASRGTRALPSRPNSNPPHDHLNTSTQSYAHADTSHQEPSLTPEAALRSSLFIFKC